MAGAPAGCPGSPGRVETPGDSNAPKTVPIFSQNQAAFDPGSEWAAPALLACRLLGPFPYAASADCGDEARKPPRERSSRDREMGARCQQVVPREGEPSGHLPAGRACRTPGGWRGGGPGVATYPWWTGPQAGGPDCSALEETLPLDGW